MAKISDARVTVQPSDNERLIEAIDGFGVKLDEFLERMEELVQEIEYGTKEDPGVGFQYD